MRRAAIVALSATLIFCPAPVAADGAPTPREGATHAVPLYGELVRGFDAPEDDPYAPGHRGLDVSAKPGATVRASADGVITFAGTVSGNRSVTIDHGDGLATSYSYLASTAVKKLDEVVGGQKIGTSGRGHDESLPPHVHLSARRDGVYVDPIELYVGTSYADLIALVA